MTPFAGLLEGPVGSAAAAAVAAASAAGPGPFAGPFGLCLGLFPLLPEGVLFFRFFVDAVGGVRPAPRARCGTFEPQFFSPRGYSFWGLKGLFCDLIGLILGYILGHVF